PSPTAGPAPTPDTRASGPGRTPPATEPTAPETTRDPRPILTPATPSTAYSASPGGVVVWARAAGTPNPTATSTTTPTTRARTPRDIAIEIIYGRPAARSQLAPARAPPLAPMSPPTPLHPTPTPPP